MRLPAVSANEWLPSSRLVRLVRRAGEEHGLKRKGFTTSRRAN